MNPKPGAILIVEDDFDTSVALREFLELEGYRATAVQSGRDALETLSRGPLPAVLLLDLRMPECSGWQLLEELGRNPQWSRIPVVVISAWLDAGIEAKSRQILARLRKPIPVPELLSLVEACCEPQ